MKRFIFKILILLFFLLLPLFIINELYVHTNYWKTENGINRFTDVPCNIELGNLGSSHGVFGFKYNSTPSINAWNFALNAQPYFYDFHILKKYINHFKKNGIVLILVSYINITCRMDYSNIRSRYYRLLPLKDLDSWSLKEYICYYKFPILSTKNIIQKIIHDLPNGGIEQCYDKTAFLSEENLLGYCKKRYADWTNTKYDNGQSGYNQNLLEISSIIDLCYDKELTPVLITLPVTNILNKLYESNSNFFLTFEKFTKDLILKYPDLLYLDYSRDKNFSNNHKLFLDGDHLNEIGAQKFTRTVVEELQKRGLLK